MEAVKGGRSGCGGSEGKEASRAQESRSGSDCIETLVS